MTKHQIENIIEKLSVKKNYDFIGRLMEYVMLEDLIVGLDQQHLDCVNEACHLAVGSPIMIGDVLEKLESMMVQGKLDMK